MRLVEVKLELALGMVVTAPQLHRHYRMQPGGRYYAGAEYVVVRIRSHAKFRSGWAVHLQPPPPYIGYKSDKVVDAGLCIPQE